MVNYNFPFSDTHDFVCGGLYISGLAYTLSHKVNI